MEKERVENGLVAAMSDPEYVLDILSSGGFPEDWGKHSLCPFCRHRGEETCPMHGVSNYGICTFYEFKGDVTESIEMQILEHLMKGKEASSNQK